MLNEQLTPGTMVADEAGALHLCETADEFVSRVIYDGRFVDTFTIEPHAVADQLGLRLTDELAETLTGEDPDEFLSATAQRLTEMRTCVAFIGDNGLPVPRADVGFTVASVTVAIAGTVIIGVAVTIYYIATAETNIEVCDASEEADLKL